MALQSQTARPVNRRSYMYHRPRRKRTRAVIVVAFIVLGTAAGIMLWPNDTAPESTDGSPTASGQGITDSASKTVAESGDSNLDDSLDRLGPPASALANVPREAISQPKKLAAKRESPETPTASRVAPSDKPVQTPLGTVTSPPPSPLARQHALQRIETGMILAKENRPLQARQTLTAALQSNAVNPGEAQMIRNTLRLLNQDLVFSPRIIPGDPFARSYVVGAGEQLGGIVKSQALAVEWRFIMRINGIQDERRIRAGQRIKLVTGPFHAVVHKSAFRLDLYLGTGPERVFVASFPVGLGEFNSTPIGIFRVRTDSKLIDPAWTNPRTREHFAGSDPKNPLGERWIGLEGIGESVRNLAGYGIHGTIEPQSIGKQASMGCIRMLPEDVKIIYETLVERISTVEIRP